MMFHIIYIYIYTLSFLVAALETRLQSVKRGDRKNYITCLKKVWDVVFEYELQALNNQDHEVV